MSKVHRLYFALRGAIPVAMTLVLAACAAVPPAAPRQGVPPLAPQAVEYNLGETTITQARFPEDSRFRNMPVRLNGRSQCRARAEGRSR